METVPPLDQLTFSGSQLEDVTAFLQTVQRIALAQGRQRDDDWRTDVATAYFTGNALEWYSDLEPEVQYSWRELRRAMLRHFRHDHSPDPPAVAPPARTMHSTVSTVTASPTSSTRS